MEAKTKVAGCRGLNVYEIRRPHGRGLSPVGCEFLESSMEPCSEHLRFLFGCPENSVSPFCGLVVCDLER